VKKLYQKFFYVPKYEKVPDTVFAARTVLSVLSAVLCVVLLCSGTYAYFTDSVSAGINKLHTATFHIAVADSTGTTLTGEYICGLTQDDMHTFTLTASGTASNGYCAITVEDSEKTTTYYTSQMSAAGISSMTLTVQAAEGSKITFVPQWGTSADYAVNQEETYGDGETVAHSVAAVVLHTVADGQTLEQLALHYQVDAGAILTYNGLTELPVAGTQIKIPGTVITEPPVMTVEQPDDYTQQGEVPEGEVPEEEPVSQPDPAEPEQTPGEIVSE